MEPLETGDPHRIGRYRLVARLGSGGMGLVYFGRSAAGRAVAVKRIHPHFASDPAFRERFAREVDAARKVSGAFTAPVIDADAQAEFPWLVTSHVPSLPLDAAVQRFGPLPEPALRVLAVGLAEALNEIHRCGLVHRDLKPGNVLLAEDGPRVIDFGIARAAEGGATQSVIGTPGFMSPEQINGQALTPGSDMFALGAVLTYAAGGSGPFGEGAMATMVMRVMHNEPEMSAVPPALRQAVAACLAKDPQQRPGPGQLLDAWGEAGVNGAWLPPQVMGAVREQAQRAQAALAAAAAESGPGADATSVMGAGSGPAATQQFPGAQVPGVVPGAPLPGPDATQQFGAGAGATDAGTTAVFPGQAQSGQGAGPEPTAVFGREPGHTQPGPAAQAGGGDPYGGDPYGGLYRGSGPPAAPQEDPRAAMQRQQEEQRRQAEERAHEERLRAEREAAQRAKREARKAKAPSLWRFAAQLPLLVLPLIQIPLGIAAAYGWQWFTASEFYQGLPWRYEPGLLSVDGFLHAVFLGYFLFNNLIGLDWVLRSLRASFIVGVVLGLIVIVGTNAMLSYFGFF